MPQASPHEIRLSRRPPYFSPEREKERARKHIQKVAEIAIALGGKDGIKTVLDLLEEEFIKAGVLQPYVSRRFAGSPLFSIVLSHNNGEL